LSGSQCIPRFLVAACICVAETKDIALLISAKAFQRPFPLSSSLDLESFLMFDGSVPAFDRALLKAFTICLYQRKNRIRLLVH